MSDAAGGAGRTPAAGASGLPAPRPIVSPGRGEPARAATGAVPPVADRNGVKEAADPLARPPRPVDLGEIARSLGQLGQGLEAVATPAVDAATNTADAVAYAPDAIGEAFRRLGKPSPNAAEQLASAVDRAQKAGRVLGLAGAAIAAKDLAGALHPEIDLPGAAEALCNLALGLATAGEGLVSSPAANAALRTVGGVAGLAASLFGVARALMDLRENGLSWSNGLALLGNALTAAGSAMCLVPGLQPLAGSFLMIGASINLAKLAVENWDAIKGGATAVAGRVGRWLEAARQWATGPPSAGPPVTAAS